MANLLRLVAQQSRGSSLLKCTNVVSVLSIQSIESKRHLFGFGKLRRVDGNAVDQKDIRLADPIEHATGLEKLLLLAEEKGIDDPFCSRPRKRGPGTKEQPNLVPSFEDKRMIGCVCEQEQTYVNYMWVHVGDPKRCECGHWFKAVPARKFWEDLDTNIGA